MAPTPRTRSGRLLAILLMAPFMAQADATIANVAAPSISADLGTSGAELESRDLSLTSGGAATRAFAVVTGAFAAIAVLAAALAHGATRPRVR